MYDQTLLVCLSNHEVIHNFIIMVHGLTVVVSPWANIYVGLTQWYHFIRSLSWFIKQSVFRAIFCYVWKFKHISIERDHLYWRNTVKRLKISLEKDWNFTLKRLKFHSLQNENSLFTVWSFTRMEENKRFSLLVDWNVRLTRSIEWFLPQQQGFKMKISSTDFLNQTYVLTYNVWNTLKVVITLILTSGVASGCDAWGKMLKWRPPSA